ncbi:hypothetical protein [Rhizobium gallicum]|uniref:hypothetical protein n=1 Tax=Rhizobium gallicum TaxID=56730 RepID=UPI001EF97BD0|nr:hypothetical protein [Rhizobium gallicum]ULJ74454.1 hypothetical protein L2W42_21585 [Rhizobium gallicum]
MAAAPWFTPLREIERFSQMLHGTNLNARASDDDASGKGPGNHEFESAEYSSEVPPGRNMLYLPFAALLGGAILSASIEIREAAEQGTAACSAKLAQLAKAIVDRISVGRDNVGEGTVQIVLHGELLGDTRVIISYRHDTLQIFIESERLRLMLQFQGGAFARDLSNRLGMRVAVTVGAHKSTPEDSDGGSRELGALHYVAEKGA